MRQKINPCIHQITLRKPSPDKKGSCVALGFFDGVHIGHLALFDEARKHAAEQGAVFAVFTFRDCGDGTYKAGAPRLTEWNERLSLLRQHNLCALLVAFYRQSRGKPLRFALA